MSSRTPVPFSPTSPQHLVSLFFYYVSELWQEKSDEFIEDIAGGLTDEERRRLSGKRRDFPLLWYGSEPNTKVVLKQIGTFRFLQSYFIFLTKKLEWRQ